MESDLRNLHTELLNAWNAGDAHDFASLFTRDGICIGFDGSEYITAQETETQLEAIFKDHQVATYVGIVREVRFLDDQTALVRAVVSMLPPGSKQVMSDRNALQVLVACKTEQGWRIASYQNTPARFDGRPQAAQALTAELQAAADKQ